MDTFQTLLSSIKTTVAGIDDKSAIIGALVGAALTSFAILMIYLIYKWKKKDDPNESDLLLEKLAKSECKNKMELYKFHQERTEKIRVRLWTTLTWLAGVQGAILGLQQQHFSFAGINIKEPSLILAIVGAFIALYMILVVSDGTKHIESNWHASDVVLGKKPAHQKRFFVLRLKDHLAFSLMAVLGILLFLFFGYVVFVRSTSVSVPSALPPSAPSTGTAPP